MNNFSDSLNISMDKDILSFIFPSNITQENAISLAGYVLENKTPDCKRIRIDMENVKTISADGLDFIIELKKKCRDITLANVSSAICEILGKYGFENLATVEKNYRFVSIAGLTALGSGSHGKVYRLDDDMIIKVFIDNCTLETIERERKFAKNAFMMGLPSPITFDVVNTEEGYGLIMEMAGAMTLGTYLSEHPEDTEELGNQFADLLIKLNSTYADPSLYKGFKDEYRQRAICAKKYLGEAYAKKLLDIIDAIPDGQNMIHGDYHLGNVMIDKNKNLMLIDMADISYGNGFFDIGSCYLTFPFLANGFKKKCTEVNTASPKIVLQVWDILIRKYYDIKTEEDYNLRIKQCKAFADLRIASVIGLSSSRKEWVTYILTAYVKIKILSKVEKYVELFSSIQE